MRTPLDYDAFYVIEDAVKNTSDWDDLKACPYDEFLIFVTGQLRKNRKRNKQYLEGCNYYGQATTWDSSFFLKKVHSYTEDDGEPLMMMFPENDLSLRKRFTGKFDYNHLGRIEGDVYGVPLRTLARIDAYEQNEEDTERVQRWVDLVHPSQHKKSVKTFMYLADMDILEDLINTGLPLLTCNTVYNTNGRCYYFNG